MDRSDSRSCDPHLHELLHPPSRQLLKVLGYDPSPAPPLFEAMSPGHPDLSRPAIHVDRTVSRHLTASLRRSFPMPKVDESVELHSKPPFRTAFSKPLSESALVPSEAATSIKPGSVLPYLAFGPLPSIQLRTGSKTPTSQKTRSRGKRAPSLPLPPARSPPVSEQDTALSRRRERETEMKAAQAVRAAKREARSQVVEIERSQRAVLRNLQMTERRALENDLDLQLSQLLEVEKERAIRRQQELNDAEVRRLDRVAQALQEERRKLVLDKASFIVETERGKVEREEQVARSKLRTLEAELLQRARRREAMRIQLEGEARDEANKAAALEALERRLQSAQPSIQSTGGGSESPEPGKASAKDPQHRASDVKSKGTGRIAAQAEAGLETPTTTSTPPVSCEVPSQTKEEALASPEVCSNQSYAKANQKASNRSDESQGVARLPELIGRLEAILPQDEARNSVSGEEVPARKAEATFPDIHLSPIPAPPSLHIRRQKLAIGFAGHVIRPFEETQLVLSFSRSSWLGVLAGRSGNRFPSIYLTACIASSQRRQQNSWIDALGATSPNLVTLSNFCSTIYDPLHIARPSGGCMVTSVRVEICEGLQEGDVLGLNDADSPQGSKLEISASNRSLIELEQIIRLVSLKTSYNGLGQRALSLTCEFADHLHLKPHRTVGYAQIISPVLKLVEPKLIAADCEIVFPFSEILVNRNPAVPISGCTAKLQLLDGSFLPSEWVLRSDDFHANFRKRKGSLLSTQSEGVEDSFLGTFELLEDESLTIHFANTNRLTPSTLQQLFHQLGRVNTNDGKQRFLVTMFFSIPREESKTSKQLIESETVVVETRTTLKPLVNFHEPSPHSRSTMAMVYRPWITTEYISPAEAEVVGPIVNGLEIRLDIIDAFAEDRLDLVINRTEADGTKNTIAVQKDFVVRLRGNTHVAKIRRSTENDQSSASLHIATLAGADSLIVRQCVKRVRFFTATSNAEVGPRRLRIEVKVPAGPSGAPNQPLDFRPSVHYSIIQVGRPLATIRKGTENRTADFYQVGLPIPLLSYDGGEPIFRINPLLGDESPALKVKELQVRIYFPAYVGGQTSDVSIQFREPRSNSQLRIEESSKELFLRLVCSDGIEREHVETVQSCLEAVQILGRSAGLTKIAVELTDLTNMPTRPQAWVQTFYLFEGAAAPTVLPDKRDLYYRQGSRSAQAGFPLLPDSVCLLPNLKTYTVCEIGIELVGGGLGDGEDVVEWLNTAQQVAHGEVRSPLEIHDSRLLLQGNEVGTFEQVVSGLKVSVRQESLTEQVLTTILHAISFRNSAAKVKSGQRLFSVRLSWGKEETLRFKITVNVAPPLFTVPSFAAKVVASSHALLPSICPKLAVNLDESQAIEPTLIQAQIVEGIVFGAMEDRISIGSTDFEMTPIEGKAESYQLQFQSTLLGEAVVSEGCFTLYPTAGMRFSGKLLAQLLKALSYESLEYTSNVEPRQVEYLVEESNGDTCLGYVTIFIHAKELPAEVDIGCQRVDYAMCGASCFLAPSARILRCPQMDSNSSVVRVLVEFLQQHLPQDSLSVETNLKEGVFIVNGNQIVMGEALTTAEAVGSYSMKGNQLSITFTSCPTIATIQKLFRSVCFRHAGKRDRQGHKKVQFSFCPKGQLWTRVSVPISMHEPSFNLTGVDGPKLKRGISSADRPTLAWDYSGLGALLKPASWINAAAISISIAEVSNCNETNRKSSIAILPAAELISLGLSCKLQHPLMANSGLVELTSSPFQYSMSSPSTAEALQEFLCGVSLFLTAPDDRDWSGCLSLYVEITDANKGTTGGTVFLEL